MKYMFAPGCGLILYKPQLVRRIHEALQSEFGPMEILLTCCHHTPAIPDDVDVINVCPGCDKRYRENYSRPAMISLWELLAKSEKFKFPDYGGRKMTIIDACPTRDQDRIHIAVRKLAEKMNISVVEPEKTRKNGTCCGDTFYGKIPAEKVKDQMKAKAASMPLDDVIVYCTSCSKSMFIGNKRPGYLVDLLCGEDTVRGTFEPDEWHGELDVFIENHREFETVSDF